MINKWRTVHYTDDGCTIYQCLSCLNEWESRTEPGYYSCGMLAEEDNPGAYRLGDNFYIDTAPMYVACQQFCSFCGTNWDGAVRCNVNNERMLGERRLNIEEAMRGQDWASPAQPWQWFVIESFVLNQPNVFGKPEVQTPVYGGAKKIHAELLRLRERDYTYWQENGEKPEHRVVVYEHKQHGVRVL